MRIHTQLHNRHHFPHNRDMRETGERHSTRVHLDDDARIIDDWRRRQSDLPARAEAIRRLIQLGVMNCATQKDGVTRHEPTSSSPRKDASQFRLPVFSKQKSNLRLVRARDQANCGKRYA
jgi:hypothetical protein